MMDIPIGKRDYYIWSFEARENFEMFPFDPGLGVNILKAPDGGILGSTRKGITRVILKVTDKEKFDERSLRTLLTKIGTVIGPEYYFKGLKLL